MSLTSGHDYDVLEKIGHGSFGIIRKVKRKSDNLILCRKEINYGKMSQKEREQLHAEFQCLSTLDHPNIVGYYHREHLKAQQELHLYMEYCGSGDLGRVIRDLKNTGKRATEPFVWTIFCQLASALYRCHFGENPPEIGADVLGLISEVQNKEPPKGQNRIMHRDLKPENVFLGKNNSVKLGDFGLSKMIKSDFASTYVGTPYYMSPEICAAERYTIKSDIWALGCIMYELCAREPPFNAKSHYELVSKIKTGRYPALPSCYSDELGATIRECLRTNPDNRPSTFHLLQLPIMRLMRKERELALASEVLQKREETVAKLETQVAEEMAALKASREYLRQEIDDSLRREWEVKAQLEITKHINAEVECLHRQYEAEVCARVEAQLSQDRARGRRGSGVTAGIGGSAPDFGPYASSEAKEGVPETDTDSDVEIISAFHPKNPDVARRARNTPMRRVQTMFAGNTATPGDVEMSEPSPIALSSLSLSPRRNPGAKNCGPGSGNIFRADAAQQADKDESTVWTLPRECGTPSSDEEDLQPSPTRNIRSTRNPFRAKNRPDLSGSTRPDLSGAKLSKPLPAVPGGGEVKAGGRTTSPSRRLSKIPSAAALQRTNTEPAPTLSRRPSKKDAKKEEPHLGKVAAKNNIRGRTLVELQQARAGGRPASVVSAPGPENTSPKRPQRPAVRRSSESLPAVWDPERDEMPSPFLVRSKGRVRA